MSSTVSLIRGEIRRENIAHALKALPEAAFERLKGAKRVFVKPNLVHHENQLASTHIDAVRAVLDAIRERSGAPIVVGDASYHGTKAAFRAFGYENLSDEYRNVRLLDLNDDETIEGRYVRKDGAEGVAPISRTVAESDFRMSVAPIKTHRDVGVTMSLKNWSVGIWVAKPVVMPEGKLWPRWPFLHMEGPRAHHASIASIYGQFKPDLGVLDGMLAMQGDGPTHGSAVRLGVALASADLVALDATGCRLMGVDPSDIGYLSMAAGQGLGAIDAGEISVVGEAVEACRTAFILPDDWEGHALAWKHSETN